MAATKITIKNLKPLNRKQLLIKAREILSNPERWCKCKLASPDSVWTSRASAAVLAPTVERYCSLGALYRASYDLLDVKKVGDITEAAERRVVDACDQLVSAMAQCVPITSEVRTGVVGYNDDHSTTHEDILALFDCAIEKVS